MKNYAPGTSRGPRSVHTLALQMALARERQEEIGARIKELRDDRRLRQQAVADRVGVTLRAYQAWEGGDSGIAWENLEALAKVFNVSEDYILSGPAESVPESDRLDRIERKLDLLLIASDIHFAGDETEAITQALEGQLPESAPSKPARDTSRRAGAKKAAPQARSQGKR